MIHTDLAIGVRFAGTILDIQARSHEYPMTLDEVKDHIEDPERYVYIAKIGNRSVGAALGTRFEDGSVLLDVGVLPSFRKIGVSRSLMNNVSKRGYADKSHCLRFIVPSYRVEDKDDPDYIGGWLERFEFKIESCKTDYFYRYGKLWDGYMFGALL